jgi:hypothetical protein
MRVYDRLVPGATAPFPRRGNALAFGTLFSSQGASATHAEEPAEEGFARPTMLRRRPHAVNQVLEQALCAPRYTATHIVPPGPGDVSRSGDLIGLGATRAPRARSGFHRGHEVERAFT